MKKILSVICVAMFSQLPLFAQDTLWVRYDDRFKANQVISLKDVDSIEFRSQQLRLYNNSALGYTNKNTASLVPTDAADMQFTDPGRYLLKPSIYGGTDYTNANATSGYNFAHSVESEHYAVFWDVRYGDDPKKIQYPRQNRGIDPPVAIRRGEGAQM